MGRFQSSLEEPWRIEARIWRRWELRLPEASSSEYCGRHYCFPSFWPLQYSVLVGWSFWPGLDQREGQIGLQRPRPQSWLQLPSTCTSKAKESLGFARGHSWWGARPSLRNLWNRTRPMEFLSQRRMEWKCVHWLTPIRRACSSVNWIMN